MPQGSSAVRPTNGLYLYLYLSEIFPHFMQSENTMQLNNKIYCHIYNRPPPVPIPSPINAVHAFPPHFWNNHFNVILLSTFRSSKWPLSFRSPDRSPICTSSLPHTCHMPSQSNYSLFTHPNNILQRVQIIKFLVM